MNAGIRLFAALIFTSLTSIAAAVPARPLYEPPALSKPPETPVDLRGTTWLGNLGTDNRVVVFVADGTLEISANKGKAMLKGAKSEWKLTGNDLYFAVNNQYFEFKGRISGDTIIGEYWNKAGMRGESKLIRDRVMK